MTETKKIFAANLRSLRKRKGMSIKQLATEMDVAFQTVQRWETAQNSPGLEDVDRLAKYFGVTVQALMSAEHDQDHGKAVEVMQTLRKLFSLLS